MDSLMRVKEHMLHESTFERFIQIVMLQCISKMTSGTFEICNSSAIKSLCHGMTFKIGIKTFQYFRKKIHSRLSQLMSRFKDIFVLHKPHPSRFKHIWLKLCFGNSNTNFHFSWRRGLMQQTFPSHRILPQNFINCDIWWKSPPFLSDSTFNLSKMKTE